MKNKKMRSTRSFFSTAFAIGIGILAGAGVALLYAPQTGQDTRQKLLTKGEEIKDKVSQDVSTTRAQLQTQLDEVSRMARSRAYELGSQLNKVIASKENDFKNKVNDLPTPEVYKRNS